VIHATAPLKELLGYRSHVRVITEGRGGLDMRFSHYEAFLDDLLSGPEEIGVPADTPRSPTPKRGSATAEPDELGE
jgi:translation elongation factor EF-G